VGELTMDVMQRLALGKPQSTIGSGEEDPYVKLLLKIFDPHPVTDSRVESFFGSSPSRLHHCSSSTSSSHL
jgi:hypothetical protein